MKPTSQWFERRNVCFLLISCPSRGVWSPGPPCPHFQMQAVRADTTWNIAKQPCKEGKRASEGLVLATGWVVFKIDMCHFCLLLLTRISDKTLKKKKRRKESMNLVCTLKAENRKHFLAGTKNYHSSVSAEKPTAPQHVLLVKQLE